MASQANMGSGKHRVSAQLRNHLGNQAAPLALALDTKMEFVAILDSAGVHLDVNAGLGNLLGYEPEQALGKTPMDLYWPRDLQERYAEIFATGGELVPHEFRLTLAHCDGRPIEVLAEVGHYAESVLGKEIFVARFREVRDSGSDARDLRESEERYRALSEYSPYGILVHSAGTIHYANDAAAKMWGGPREELLASSLLTMVHPEFREEVMKRITSMLGDKSTVPTLREKLVRRDGTAFYADVLGTPIHFDGKPAVQLVIRDVTDDVNRDASVAQANRLEAIGNLTASVAHDFNNLLTVVLASCALASRRVPDNKKLQSDLLAAQTAAKRGGALTKQLLAFGRVQEPSERTVILSDVVSEISLLLNKLLGESIEWTLDTQPNLWASHLNSLQVEQVIMNLASNAKKAMPTGGTLRMTLRNVDLDDTSEFESARDAGLRPGKFVELKLADDGHGMDSSTQSRIVGESFSAGVDKSGSGLGLATVYSIVRDTGGVILVESTPTEGATFTMYFPAAATSENLSQTASEPVPSTRGTETVLLIEDQESVRNAIRGILELHDYRVVEAEGIVAARTILADMLGDLDIIVSDVMMADGTGPEIVEEALGQRPDLPVLFVTGFAKDAVLDRRDLSADAPVLAKPFTPTQLCQHVRRLLDQE